MPCSDGGPDINQIHEAHLVSEGLAKGLCSLCKIYTQYMAKSLPPTLSVWYEAHLAGDNLRDVVNAARDDLANFRRVQSANGLIVAYNHPRQQHVDKLVTELSIVERREREAAIALGALRP